MVLVMFVVHILWHNSCNKQRFLEIGKWHTWNHSFGIYDLWCPDKYLKGMWLNIELDLLAFEGNTQWSSSNNKY